MVYFLWVFALALASPESDSILTEPMLGADYQSARATAMGGAQRSIASGIDSIYLNPATMMNKKQYLAEIAYAWGQYSSAHRPFIGVVDSNTTVFAAGIAYGFEKRFTSGNLDVHRAHFALGYMYRFLGIGLTGKYIKADRSELDKLNEPYKSTYKKTTDFFTADLGIIINPIKQLSVGLVGYNIIPVYRELAPSALGVAISGCFYGFQIAFDTVIDFQSKAYSSTDKKAHAQARYHLGAEYLIKDTLPIRAGWIFDKIADSHYWSVGTGYQHRLFIIDFAYRQALDRPVNRYIQLSFAFRFEAL